ncbi:RraA family protein [Frigidibacter oleivorans]|uniref:RraA family protein n=1 Tax=Frigidibacter oleivorans TaxID=2487129 RepID=UPI000F8F1418|nr:RraA family protein [Frigidibacter oleivorans]
MTVGFRVFCQRKLPSPAVVESFGALPSANVADVMNRLNSLPAGTRLQGPRLARPVAGVALTVQVAAGDNLLIHKALDMAQEGDVIVVSNGGAQTQALMGEVMFGYAKFRKVAAIVFDGPIRDIDSLETLGLPVFATGTRPGGPMKQGPGQINVPIAFEGCVVNPGDIVLADNDGVVIVPRNDAEDVLAKARALSANDQAKVAAGRDGTLDRSWVDAALKKAGCEFIEAAHE